MRLRADTVPRRGLCADHVAPGFAGEQRARPDHRSLEAAAARLGPDDGRAHQPDALVDVQGPHAGEPAVCIERTHGVDAARREQMRCERGSDAGRERHRVGGLEDGTPRRRLGDRIQPSHAEPRRGRRLIERLGRRGEDRQLVVRLGIRPWSVVHGQPPGHAVAAVVVRDPREQVGQRAQPVRGVERRPGQPRCGRDRQFAVIQDADVLTARDRRVPQPQVRLLFDPVEPRHQRGALADGVRFRRKELDRVARPDRALAHHARIHPAVGRVGQDRDAPEAAVTDVRPLGATRHRRRREFEQHLVADADARASGKRRPLDADRREVLPDAARLRRVAFGLEPLDRLHAEQTHGAIRPAVDGVLAHAVALEPERQDAGLGHGQLRHAAAADVHLVHAAGGGGEAHRRDATRQARRHIRKTPNLVSGIGALRRR
jgi:hypothetical protein